MAHKFYSGQKVVCVDDRYSNQTTMEKFIQWIVRDQTYTIRQHRPEGAEAGVLLVEITNPPTHFPHLGGKLEPAFHPKRFVPLNEKEAEMVEVKKNVHEMDEMLN